MLKSIEKLANSYNNDLTSINKRLKTLASQKSRLKNQKGLPNYEEKMREILDEYQALTEAKNLLEPKSKTCMDWTQDDINIMTYDEVMKGKNSIASKKSHTRWLTTIEGDNDEFRKACQIENMLNERLKVVKPIEDTVVRKSDIIKIIDTIKASGDLSQERIVELLEGLI